MAIKETVEYVLNLGGNLKKEAADTASSVSTFSSAAGAGIKVAGGLSSAVIAAGAAFAAFANDIYGTVDTLNTLAASSGLANETVAGLRLAAKAANKDLKDLIPTELAKKMLDAENGLVKAQRAFDQLGVSVKDNEGRMRSVDLVYRDLVRSLLEIEDPTKRAALATQVMGEQGKQALSAFSDVGDLERFVASAEKFGINAGPAAVEASNNWWKATSNLSLAFENLKMKFSPLSSAASTFINSFSLGFVYLTELANAFGDFLLERFDMMAKSTKMLLEGDVRGAFDLFDSYVRKSVDGSAFREMFDRAEKRAREFWQLNIAGAAATGDALGDALGGAGGGGGGRAGLGVTATARSQSEDTGVSLTVDEYLVDTFEVLGSQVEAVGDELSGLDESIAAILQSTQGDAFGMFSAQLSGMASMLGGAVSTALGPLEFIAALPDQLMGLMDHVDDLVNNLVDIPSKVAGLIERLPEVMANIATMVPQMVGGLITSLPDILTAIVTFIPTLIGEIIRMTIESFANVFSLDFWKDAGKAMAQAIGDAIKGILSPLKDKQGRVLGTDFTAEGGRSLFGIKLPEFEVGTDMIKRQGMAYVHEGEAILPAPMAAQFRSMMAGGGGSRGGVNFGGVTIVGGNPRELAPQLQRMLGLYGVNLDLSEIV